MTYEQLLTTPWHLEVIRTPIILHDDGKGNYLRAPQNVIHTTYQVQVMEHGTPTATLNLGDNMPLELADYFVTLHNDSIEKRKI